MLAGVIKGLGLLDAYEIERRPITDQVSRHAMPLATTWERRYGAIPRLSRSLAPGATNVRRRIGRAAAEITAQGMCCGGLNFGYFYYFYGSSPGWPPCPAGDHLGPNGARCFLN
jgi:hypothetical protein